MVDVSMCQSNTEVTCEGRGSRRRGPRLVHLVVLRRHRTCSQPAETKAPSSLLRPCSPRDSAPAEHPTTSERRSTSVPAFCNVPASTEIYTRSLRDALPIYLVRCTSLFGCTY